MIADTLSSVKDVSDIASNAATVVALALGGVWTFYHFFKGRVFKPRLTLKGTAHAVRTHAGDHVVCGISVANTGLAMVQKADADVTVYTLSGTGGELCRVGGDRILRSHEWIEAGTVLNEQTVIWCPRQTPVVLADFRIVVRAKGWFGRRSSRVAFTTNAVNGNWAPMRGEGERE